VQLVSVIPAAQVPKTIALPIVGVDPIEKLGCD
jgi:hypothetical protein